MSLRPMDTELKRRMSPSIALLVLAALTPKVHEVFIEDENINNLHLDDRPDLVGITVNVDTSERAYEIAKHYRKKGVKVVLGGIHVSAVPEEAIQHADAICVGEAEDLWFEILNDTLANKLRGIYLNQNDVDIKNSPIPNWGSIIKRKYLYTNIVVASRGCPHKCAFCYNSCKYVSRKFRNKSVDQVLEEIENLETNHIMFIDDNFVGDPEWTKEFCHRIKNKSLTWHCAVSTNIVNDFGLIDQMSESGCKSMFIGFESINTKSLKSVSKSQNKIENYEKLISKIHQNKMMVNASLVFGFDHDKEDVFENNLKWLVHNKVDSMTAHILTPYPGTILFDKLTKENRIIDFDWRKYNTANVVFQPKNMSPKQLYEGYLWIYEQFYSIKNIVKRMPEKNLQKIPFLLFNLGYRKFGKLTSFLGKMGLMNSIGRLGKKLSYGI